MRKVFHVLCLMTVLLLTSCGKAEQSTDIPSDASYSTEQETQAESAISTGFADPGGQDFAPLYQEPDTASTVLARTYTGDALSILELQGTWYRVRFGELTGYMEVTHVTFEQPTESRTESKASSPAKNESQAIDYYSAYSSLIEKYDRDTENVMFRWYGLFDIDGDGVLELIAEYGDGEAGRKAEIWNTSHTLLGEVFTGHSVWETNGGTLYLDMGHMGYQAVNRVELQNGEIVETEIYNSGEQMLEEYASYGNVLPTYDFSDMTGLTKVSLTTAQPVEITPPKPAQTTPPKSSKPTANISIEVEPPPAWADGDTFYLRVNGNYSYYEYDVYVGNEPGNYGSPSHGTSSESRMRVTAGSDILYVYAIVTPVSATGEKGETVTTTGTNFHPSNAASGSPESCFLWGEINTHGGVVASFTTSYVVDGGAASHVRDELGNGWHIDAKRKCISHGVQWFEVYDSDDGDYYGWLDVSYIDFYAGG